MSGYLVIYGCDLGELDGGNFWGEGREENDGDGPNVGIYPCPANMSWDEVGDLVGSHLKDLIGDGSCISNGAYDESKYPEEAIYRKMVDIAIRDKKPFWWVDNYAPPNQFYLGQLLHMTRTHPKALWCVHAAVCELGWDGTTDGEPYPIPYK